MNKTLLLKVTYGVYLAFLFMWAVKLQVNAIIQLENPLKSELYVALIWFTIVPLCLIMILWPKPKKAIQKLLEAVG